MLVEKPCLYNTIVLWRTVNFRACVEHTATGMRESCEMRPILLAREGFVELPLLTVVQLYRLVAACCD